MPHFSLEVLVYATSVGRVEEGKKQAHMNHRSGFRSIAVVFARVFRSCFVFQLLTDLPTKKGKSGALPIYRAISCPARLRIDQPFVLHIDDLRGFPGNTSFVPLVLSPPVLIAASPHPRLRFVSTCRPNLASMHASVPLQRQLFPFSRRGRVVDSSWSLFCGE